MAINNNLAKQTIAWLEQLIANMGYTPVLHFELEGGFQPAFTGQMIDFDKVNQAFKLLDIDGVLIPEYWQNQWEFVSSFNGQSPLKEANNLANVFHYLPKLLKQQGIPKTFISPVIWSGDSGQLASGSKNIFTQGERAVHIPNAIQVNLSVKNSDGINLIAEDLLGEYLQQLLIENSLACSLLFLPDEASFERLALKTKYGLNDELCSPNDISGGHQGSIALYRKIGKHNQALGVKPLVLSANKEALITEQDWQLTARVEHRLGAASLAYNPYINVIFALLNLYQALSVYKSGNLKQSLKKLPESQPLPNSLDGQGESALNLFKQDTWFESSLNSLVEDNVDSAKERRISHGLGSELKKQILAQYQIKLAY